MAVLVYMLCQSYVSWSVEQMYTMCSHELHKFWVWVCFVSQISRSQGHTYNCMCTEYVTCHKHMYVILFDLLWFYILSKQCQHFGFTRVPSNCFINLDFCNIYYCVHESGMNCVVLVITERRSGGRWKQWRQPHSRRQVQTGQTKIAERQ